MVIAKNATEMTVDSVETNYQHLIWTSSSAISDNAKTRKFTPYSGGRLLADKASDMAAELYRKMGRGMGQVTAEEVGVRYVVVTVEVGG